MREIFKLQRIAKMVISDRDVKFTSTFWKSLFIGIGAQILFSIAYHMQTDGKTERRGELVLSSRMFSFSNLDHIRYFS